MRIKEKMAEKRKIWQCYKISSAWDGDRGIDFQKFSVNLEIKFMKVEIVEHTKVVFAGGKWKKVTSYMNETVIPINVKVWITSEENSYGLTDLRWWDGEVVNPALDVELRSAPSYSQYKTIKVFNHHELRVVEVNEYQDVDSSCFEVSYYECLAKRFKNQDLSQLDHETKNGSKCDN